MFDRRFHDNICHDAQALISSTKADLRPLGGGLTAAVARIGTPLNRLFLSKPDSIAINSLKPIPSQGTEISVPFFPLTHCFSGGPP